MQQEVEIFVAGRKVKQIAHDGKIFIIAKAGQEYEIKLRNNSTSRVMGVCSVDGRNVVDGELADDKGAGYIINGYGSYTIRGFRTSNDEVHPFLFDRKEKSYANKVEDGSTQDCGAIGVVFWAEKYKPSTTTTVIHKHEYYPRYPYLYPHEVRPYWDSITYTSATPGFQCYGTQNMGTASGQNQGSLTANVMNCSMGDTTSGKSSMLRSASPEFDLGTKFSESSLEDKVVNSEFEIGCELSRFTIYYASRDQLEAMGVPVNQAREVAFPEPFRSQGFCKIPKK